MASNIDIQKKCEWCGKLFIAHKTSTRCCLHRCANLAYKEKMLRENLNDFLEKIEWKEVKKEYLTLDEVKLLAATPCRIPVLKQASLFACMTELRISDILKLQWSDFEVSGWAPIKATTFASVPRRPRLRQHSPSASKRWNYAANGAKD